MADYNAGTIRATVDANTRPYSRAMTRAAATTTATTRAIERDANRASSAIGGLSGNAKVLSGRMFDLGAAVAGIGIPGIVSLVRPAAGAIDALAGGAVIATKSITDMSGAIAGVPIALSAFAQGMGAAKFATMGLSDAVKAYASGDNEAIREALKGTSAEAAAFAKELVSMQPAIEQIRDAAAAELFPGLTSGIQIAAQNMPILKASMKGTAAVLGDLADEAGRLLGSEGFGDRFGTITARNADLLQSAGSMGIKFADALSILLVEAKPVADYMTQSADALGSWAQNAARAGAASGGLRDYFRDSVSAFDDWVEILKSAGSSIGDVFSGATGATDDFRQWLVDTTAGWEKWAESAKGTQAIEDFFDRIQPSLKAAGDLFGQVVKAIWDLGNTDEAQKAFVSFANALTYDLLPALTALASDVGPQAATNLVDLATGIAKVLNMGSFNPILDLVGAFGDLVGAIADIVNVVPGASTAIGVLSAYFVATRIVNLTKFAAGISGIGKAFVGLKAAMTGVAAVGPATALAQQAAAMQMVNVQGKMMAQTTSGLIVPANTAAQASAARAAGATAKMGGAAASAGLATGALAGALPGLAIALGVGLTMAIMDANAAADEFTQNWTALKGEMAGGDFEEAAKQLDTLRSKIEENKEAMSENTGVTIDPRTWDNSFKAAMAEIENKGFKGALTFWDDSDDGGLTEALDTQIAEYEKFQSTWLTLKADFEKKMGEQGSQEWAEALDMGLGRFHGLAAEAGVDLEKLVSLTGTEYTAALDRAVTKTAVYYTTQIKADEATKTFYNSVTVLNDKMATSAEKASAAEAALGALSSTLTQGESTAIDAAETMDTYRQSIKASNLVLNKAGDALKHNNQQTREGARFMLSMVDTTNALATSKFAETEATRGTSAAVRQMSNRYREQYQRTIDLIKATGKSGEEARKIAKAYMATPKKVETIFKDNAAEVIRRLKGGDSLTQILEDLDKKKANPKIDVEGMTKAEQDVENLRKRVESFVRGDYNAGVTVTGAVDPSSDQYLFRKANGSTVPLGSISAYAEGGPVRGMGGSRSDNIPAWLSNGEFVVQAAAVRKYGVAFFNRLNEGAKSSAKGFANGGVVASGVAMSEREQAQAWKKLYDRIFRSIDDKSTSKDDAKNEAKARKQANKEMDRILKQATRNLERSMKQVVRSMEQAAKAAVKAAQQAYNQRVQSVKQGIQGFGSITQTGGTEYLSGAGLVEEMQARAAAAKAFRKDYNALEDSGLNKKSLKEILAAGPQEGAAIADALLEGSTKAIKDRIKEINQLEQQISKTGKGLGTEAAINEGLRGDIRDAKDNLRAVKTTEVTVSEGAVKVAIDLSGVDKQDARKIEQVVDRSVNQALKEFARELKRN